MRQHAGVHPRMHCLGTFHVACLYSSLFLCCSRAGLSPNPILKCGPLHYNWSVYRRNTYSGMNYAGQFGNWEHIICPFLPHCLPGILHAHMRVKSSLLLFHNKKDCAPCMRSPFNAQNVHSCRHCTASQASSSFSTKYTVDHFTNVSLGAGGGQVVVEIKCTCILIWKH